MEGGGSADQLHVLLGCAQLHGERLRRQRASDVQQQPGWQHSGSGAGDVGLERYAQADLHVGGKKLGRRVGGGRDHHAGERLNGAARGGDSGRGLELRQEIG